MSTRVDERSPRQRLLETADRLFYAEGIHTVGIDRILDEAGVAKASLYKCFGSKDGLVKAYLEGRHARQKARIARALDRAGDDPRARLLAVFDAQAELFATPGFRGCAFAAATAEVPIGDDLEQVSADYRGYVRRVFRELAVEAGATDPFALACQLHLLYDGAQQVARTEHASSVAEQAHAAAGVLIDAALVH